MSYILDLIKKYFVIFLAGFAPISLLSFYTGEILSKKPEFGYGYDLVLNFIFIFFETFIYLLIQYLISRLVMIEFTLKEIFGISILSYSAYFLLGPKIESYLFAYDAIEPFFVIFCLSGLIFLIFILMYSIGRKYFQGKILK